MMRRARRMLMVALLLVVAGAIINVAVAWGCAIGLRLDCGAEQATFAVRDQPNDYWWFSSVHRPGAFRVRSIRSTLNEHGSASSTDPVDVVPAWTGLASELERPDRPGRRTVDARGWPMLSLSCDFQWSIPDQEERTSTKLGGIPLESNPINDDVLAPRAVPLRPLWPGFAINTLFYALALWGFWTAMRAAIACRWRATHVCALLLLGAVANVGVAWALAFVPSIGSTTRSLREVDDTFITHVLAAGWRRSTFDDEHAASDVRIQIHARRGVTYRLLTESPNYLGPHRGFVVYRVVAIECTSGFPMHSLRGLVWNDVPDLKQRRGQVLQPSPGRLGVIEKPVGYWMFPQSDLTGFMQRHNGRFLPLLPMPIGFAINTLLYAAALWLLFVAPFALRRRRRIKCGLCARCAYDLRGSPTSSDACPECGGAIQPRRGDGM